MLRFCNGEPPYERNGSIGAKGLFVFGLIYIQGQVSHLVVNDM